MVMAVNLPIFVGKKSPFPEKPRWIFFPSGVSARESPNSATDYISPKASSPALLVQSYGKISSIQQH
jgi:hypothetical protein